MKASSLINNKRLPEIDFAIGIAISLVVFGHMSFLQKSGIIWYSILRTFIYKFHMNLFFFLTGILFFYTKDIDSPFFSCKNFIKSKIKKFAPPYFFYAALFFLGELVFSKRLNFSFSNLIDYFFIVLYKPILSYSTFLWFLQILFLYYITIPFFLRLIKYEYRIFIIALCFILCSLWRPENITIRLYFRYLPWFLLGMIYVTNIKIISNNVKKFSLHYFSLFIILFILDSFFFKIDKIIISFISIIVILGTSLKINKISIFFKIMGQNSFPIYLQNMTIVGVIYITLTRQFKIDSYNLQFFFPVFFILSITVPLLIKKIIPKNFKFLKMVLGYSI